MACIELSVDPKAIGSIEFLAPTVASLIKQDTLRDTTGAIAPLRARVFSADGEEMTDIEVTFVNTDSLVTIKDGNLVVSTRDTVGFAKVYATAGGLQSNARSIEVIRRPDSIAPRVAVDTVAYKAPTTGTSLDTASVGFIVRSGTNTVGSVRVTFRLYRGGTLLAPGDTVRYALVTALGRVSTVDTTDASGLALRVLRVRTPAGTTETDTLVVRASTALGGPPLKGDTIAVTILVRPL
ncbi:MAG: hypothetical protein ABI910_21860 [Gemmatimonadota bacterium]